MNYHLNNGLFINICTEVHSRVMEELKQLSCSLIISHNELILNILLTFLYSLKIFEDERSVRSHRNFFPRNIVPNDVIEGCILIHFKEK